jgi:hypothetical protein
VFWTVAGVVLAVALLGAWLYDRRFGMDMTHRDRAAYDQGRADQGTSRLRDDGGAGGF